MTERRTGQVLLASSAARDLEEIARYLAQDSPARARELVGRLLRAARTLRQSSARGRVVPELRALGLHAWRELVVRPYRVVYRLDGKTVLVLAVLDGRRDLEDLLLERLLRG
ncbi:MAG TPA: type II toxin-antitoxin system RelE/ParE family toxin [Myxococcota bacterium]|nr:type II toxin-antitoxin system RelE/ParE family toxin [Myxococcota bacterium]HRY93246.1 type II toxin-antitoxin system RelE/ParE family toxin [Myxococcota bacterium]HSA20692.1 type II toxin-antitoxin system RelE/ParE family toxin [Myxococcota bacterium]